MSIQQKIVEEILEEQKEKDGVIAINILGSVAKGKEKEKSDVDIQIVSEKENNWSLNNYERYGIKIDFEIYPKTKLLERFNNYPYLCYVLLEAKPIFDPKHFMKDLLQQVKEYFKKHPEVLEFWEKKEEEKKELKKQGKDEGFAVKCYDEAEIKFSKEGKITRDFFRGIGYNYSQ